MATRLAKAGGDPSLETEMVAVEKITAHPENPRVHPDNQLAAIGASYDEFGFIVPCVVDENFRLIAGEGRWLEAKNKGWKSIPCVVVRGWSESKKRRFLVAENQLPMLGGFDDVAYRAVLSTIKGEGISVEALGFTDATLEQALQDIDEQERGKLLELVDITIADPKHEVSRGEHFILSGRHHLICESVISGWPKWAPLLKDDAMFCPYPGIFVPFSARAKTHPLLLVQPDPYMVGHILDHWQKVHGKKAIERVGG